MYRGYGNQERENTHEGAVVSRREATGADMDQTDNGAESLGGS